MLIWQNVDRAACSASRHIQSIPHFTCLRRSKREAQGRWLHFQLCLCVLPKDWAMQADLVKDPVLAAIALGSFLYTALWWEEEQVPIIPDFANQACRGQCVFKFPNSFQNFIEVSSHLAWRRPHPQTFYKWCLPSRIKRIKLLHLSAYITKMGYVCVCVCSGVLVDSCPGTTYWIADKYNGTHLSGQLDLPKGMGTFLF